MSPLRLPTSRGLIKGILVGVATLAGSILQVVVRSSCGSTDETLQLRAIERIPLPELLRVVLELEGDVDYRYQRLPDPNRLYLI